MSPGKHITPQTQLETHTEQQPETHGTQPQTQPETHTEQQPDSLGQQQLDAHGPQQHTLGQQQPDAQHGPQQHTLRLQQPDARHRPQQHTLGLQQPDAQHGPQQQLADVLGPQQLHTLGQLQPNPQEHLLQGPMLMHAKNTPWEGVRARLMVASWLNLNTTTQGNVRPSVKRIMLATVRQLFMIRKAGTKSWALAASGQ